MCRRYRAVRVCFDFFFSSRRRHTRLQGDWSSDVCSSDLSLAVHAPETPACILFGEPLTHHGVANLAGDSDTRRTGSKDDHALVAQRRPADADGGDGSGQRDGAGALYIVVEGADAVAVLLEDAASVARREVIPLQEYSREERGHGLDVSVDESVVALSPYPGVAVPDVRRVGQQTFAVGADIEHDGDHTGRVNAARGGVNRQFADRDLNAAGPPIADSEDLLGIGQIGRA